MMLIREMSEQKEVQTLSKYATLAIHTKGRDFPIEECNIRTVFQRDRDRIVHCKAFRRLKHKTQVFIAPEGDHYRTRLTHTLEVSQIARTISRALTLNEDLTEAIALGHDLGHTPFGHTGEKVLNQICPYGFQHYEQSIRVVERLEGGTGLNLTYEVRDGIKNHTGNHMAETLEGQVIKFADRIAYINHDIDDAIRGGVIDTHDIPQDSVAILGEHHSQRINSMIMAIITESMDQDKITMRQEILEAMMSLRQFMFETVYVGSVAKGEDQKAENVIAFLYDYFLSHPEKLPDDMDKEDIHRSVCDYIAGMTDQYAIHTFQNFFIPHSWSVY